MGRSDTSAITTYMSGIALLIGVGLLYPDWNPVDLVAPAVVLAIFHVRVVRAEEPALLRRFGARYEAYLRSVPRWIPARPAIAREP